MLLRRLTNTSVCPRCSSGTETMDHLFRECPATIAVWRELSFHKFLQDNQMGFLQWLTWVFSQSSTPQHRIFCVAVWAIWGDRNNRLHKKDGKSGKEVGRFVHSYISDLDAVGKNRLQSSIPVKIWTKPVDKVVKINFDAAYDGRQSKAAIGVVARDKEGSVLLSCTEVHQRVPSAFGAEAIACRKALQIGVNLIGRVPEAAEIQAETERAKEPD
ncbi:uncharacterized protein [Gossypium hirsutum]|uniref:RNase H type-1 domain-containing protein n=1 Tax=Gossypium hirsutum TaxID=3635 RepID=A0ABM3BG13_GOSHI|nr:uncharacterized protein LOC121225675 [Gossypium hirsutum]